MNVSIQQEKADKGLNEISVKNRQRGQETKKDD